VAVVKAGVIHVPIEYSQLFCHFITVRGYIQVCGTTQGCSTIIIMHENKDKTLQCTVLFKGSVQIE